MAALPEEKARVAALPEEKARVAALPEEGAAPALGRQLTGEGPPGPGRERIAACVIAQDEQEHLPKALASVAFCDETIVVDGGSRDGTVEVARAGGARVIENPWPGYAIQRNVALDAAQSDWILEVDADERVSPELRASIEALLAAAPPGVGMGVFALRHHFLGGWLGPSAKYPAYRSRLFRRSVYRHDEARAVHEGIEPRELPLVLPGDLEHELAGTLREALLDTWRYARLESGHVAAPSGAWGYLKGIALRPAMKLIYRTVVDGGWRDGWRGLLKISLDVGSDVLVWTLVALRALRGIPVQVQEDDGTHFGRRRAGPMRIVGLAGRGRSARAAASWLRALQAQGADVALIYEDERRAEAHTRSDAGVGEDIPLPTRPDGSPGEDIPLRAVKRLGPLSTPRAVDIEMQLRIIDALVPFGTRARLAWRLLPGNLRWSIPGVGAKTPPEQAFESAQAALRSCE